MDYGFFSNNGGDPTEALRQHQAASRAYSSQHPASTRANPSTGWSVATHTQASQTPASVSGWGSVSYANGDASTANSGAYQNLTNANQSTFASASDAQSSSANQGQGGAQSGR